MDWHSLFNVPPAVYQLIVHARIFHRDVAFLIQLLGLAFPLVPQAQSFKPVVSLCHRHQLLQRADKHAPHDPRCLSRFAFAVNRIDNRVKQLRTHRLYRTGEGSVVQIAREDVNYTSELCNG